MATNGLVPHGVQWNGTRPGVSVPASVRPRTGPGSRRAPIPVRRRTVEFEELRSDGSSNDGSDDEEPPDPVRFINTTVKPTIFGDLFAALQEYGCICERNDKLYFLPGRFISLCDQSVTDPDKVPPNVSKWVRYLLRVDEASRHLIHGNVCVINEEGSLSIPFKKLYNLKASMLLYIMHTIAFGQNKPGGMFASVSTSDQNFRNPYDTRTCLGYFDSTVHNKPVCFNIPGKELHIDTDHFIPWEQVLFIYSQALKMIESILHTNFSSTTGWHHRNTVISGDFLNIQDSNVTIRFKLIPMYTNVFFIATAWEPVIGEALEKAFPEGNAYKVVANRDAYCFVYSLILAVGLVEDRGLLLSQDKVVPETSLRAAVSLNAPERHPKCKQILDNFITYKSPLDGKWDYLFSTRDFIQFMREYEERFIPEEWGMPLDVYMITAISDKCSHLIPVYMSKRNGENRISLLSVNTSHLNHYCVITDLTSAFKQTGNKIFYNCHKCHRPFFSQNLLKVHRCSISDEECKSDFVWSNPLEHVEGKEDFAPPYGFCTRCHLQFDKPHYIYHEKHCMMQFRSGNKYVRLPLPKSSEPLTGDETPMLMAEEVPENETLGSNYIMFADFECYIAPDGEHKFMSYGLYDPNTSSYYFGEELEEFMNAILKISASQVNTTVFFHNAMNYDANFILRYVLQHNPHMTYTTPLRPQVIMESLNRLKKLSFNFRNTKESPSTPRKLIIGDTFMFLTLSLERIVSSVRKTTATENMIVFPRFYTSFFERYPWVSMEDVNMILKKNLFPYKFFDDKNKLDTPIEAFLDVFQPRAENLKYFSESVTLEDLEKKLPLVIEISSTFRCRYARDYHDIYLRCDVLQLSDVFMSARRAIYETHHVDLANYTGMPSASWHAFLRHDPSLCLPLYTDTRFAEFFSHMTRGGVTSAPLRFCKANSHQSICYFDVNGLYPFVMQEFAYPTGQFEWMEAVLSTYPLCQSDPVTWLTREYFPYLEVSGKGACLEVDMHITDELKLLTDQYPFAPEHRTIHDEYFDGDGNLTTFLQKWSMQNDGESVKPFSGLVGTLYDKKEYGVHWKLLKFYIEHGMEITKIHRIVQFDEGFYLRDYVHLNISLRNNRTDELGKMVYKLMGNSVYGKTFENPFNHGKFLIIRNQDKLTGLLEEGNVAAINPIDENTCVVKLDGEEIVLDKPTYIGACVTEYAKLHMYRILYDQLPLMFPEGVELVYTDTDSFIVRVTHPEGWTATQLFDHIKSVIPNFLGSKGGQLKSETGEDLIDEVIALRSKVYAYRTKDGHIGKRAKGTTAAAQATQLDWEKYKEALIDLRAVPTHNSQFVRSKFGIKTTDLLKVSLSANDGKRRVEPDGIHTRAFGFYKNDNPLYHTNK